jgi:hypothetical protein
LKKPALTWRAVSTRKPSSLYFAIQSAQICEPLLDVRLLGEEVVEPKKSPCSNRSDYRS